MGATQVVRPSAGAGGVSIHAPVMGATCFCACKSTPEEGVSIHAPVMGATLFESKLRSRSPVSIHAPVMGATRAISTTQLGQQVSIHAPVMGATELRLAMATAKKFQSTRP